jgi:hypothetical protein
LKQIALLAHKKTLEEGLDRTKNLLETIDNTINHLRGKQKMKDEGLYKGFDSPKKGGTEAYLVNYQGTIAEDLVLKSKQKTVERSEAELKALDKEGHRIYKAVAECMEKGLTAKSEFVQKLVHQHYQMTGRVHEVNKDVYLSLAQMYCEHPDFKKWFAQYYPELENFMAEAMRIYSYETL